MNLDMLDFPTVPRASKSEGHLNRYLWVLLAVTNAVDLLASKRAFALGVAELNPAVDLIASHYGLWALGLFKAFWIVILAFLLPYIRGWTQALLAISCLAYCAVTAIHIAYLSPLL